MRGPAGVGNPGFATQMLFVGLCRQIGHTPSRTDANKAIAVKDSHTGRVIAPVFELAQAFQQNTDDVLASYCCDDTAHTSDSDVLNNLRNYTGHPPLGRDISL